MNDLGAAQRARLHGLIAAALEHEPDPPAATLAYHYVRAGDQDHAVRYLEQAGDRALELRAYGEAEGYYRDLVAHLEQLGRTIDAAHARERLGEVLISAGRYVTAMRVIDSAEEVYRAAGAIEGLARVLVLLGQVFGLRGQAPEGLARLLPRIEQLERHGLSASGHAALLVTLGHLLTACSRYTELLAVSERAIDLARDAEDPRLEGRATMRRGIALAALGRLDEAADAFNTAVRVSETTGDLWNLSIALSNQADVYSRRGELMTAQHSVEQARETAERFGGASMMVLRWCECSQVAFLLGEWQRARQDVERAMGMLETMEESWTTAYALTCLGELTAAEGRLGEAVPLLEQAIGFTERSGDRQILTRAQRVAAELDLLASRPAAACARLELLRDRHGEHEADVTAFLHLLAWARLDLGDEREAIVVADESIERARAGGLRLALADGLRVRAQIAVRAHDWASASEALEEAFDLCRSMHAPYAEARTLYCFGLLHTQQGGSRAGRRHFAAALAILDRLGERLYAERVRSALATRSTPEAVNAQMPLAKRLPTAH